MKAGVYTHFHTMEYMDIETPKITDGNALVRITHCGISPVDVEAYAGKNPNVEPPRILGHKICGIVEEVKPNDRYKSYRGREVVVDPVIPCGKCDVCAKGMSNLCSHIDIVGFTRNGGLAEYVEVPIQSLHPISSNGDRECYTLATSLASALHVESAVDRTQTGHSVIIGSWPVDILCGLLLNRMKGRSVDIIDTNSFRLNIARSLGLSCIDLSSSNLNRSVQFYLADMVTEPNLVIIGTSYIDDPISLAAELIADHGQMLLTGGMNRNVLLEHPYIVGKELLIRGSRLYTKEDFTKSIDDILLHGSEYRSMITHRLPLECVIDGIRILETVEESMKVVITV